MYFNTQLYECLLSYQSLIYVPYVLQAKQIAGKILSEYVSLIILSMKKFHYCDTHTKKAGRKDRPNHMEANDVCFHTL